MFNPKNQLNKPETISSVHLLFLLLLFFLTSCASFPSQELTNYREAYIEAQKAGDLLYDELAAAVVRSGKVPTTANCVKGSRLPKCFDPVTARNAGAPADIPSIQARRLALNAVETYNLATVDLLEGKRGDAIESRINDLKDIATDLLVLGSVTSGPLPALLGGQSIAMLNNLIKRLDNLAAQQQVRSSLIQNKEVVAELVDLLIEDTPKMYDLYFVSQASYARSLENPNGSASKAAISGYAQIGSYHDQLTAYVKLLDQTKTSFAQLMKALKEGTPSTSDVRATIRESIEIRSAAEDFWSEVRKSRK